MAAPQLKKTLLAFDFDNTVVDANTDLDVIKMHDGPIPEEIEKLYCQHNGWNDYMKAIFALLHSKNVSINDIKSKVLDISLASGMKGLFNHLADEQYEVVIISDANTLFIEWLMDKHDISAQVARVFSNPAEVTGEGKLTISYYHRQDWCDMSSNNMCKGFILEDYIKEREKAGVIFSRVMYVGDGSNDFCPTLRLSANDYVFPRVSYSLERRINEHKDKVKAQVVPWTCATSILETLTKLNSKE